MNIVLGKIKLENDKSIIVQQHNENITSLEDKLINIFFIYNIIHNIYFSCLL